MKLDYFASVEGPNNNHALNCLFSVHAIDLLPRHGRPVLKFDLGTRTLHVYAGISFGIIGRSLGRRIIGTDFSDDVTIVHVTVLLRHTLALRRRSRCSVLPQKFSSLAVSCVEFLYALDLPEMQNPRHIRSDVACDSAPLQA